MFGIPIIIGYTPNLISVFDMKTNLLYHCENDDNRGTEKDFPLACTLLRFNLDILTEYDDIDRLNKLIDRED
jgi:hypothetical protein